MEIPFSIDEFLGVFEAYNRAIEPVQWLGYGMGAVAVVWAIRGGRNSGKIILTILAAFWAWVGVVYQFLYFGPLNPAAYIFGTFFLLQSVLLLYVGFRSTPVTFQVVPSAGSVIGAGFILYAMLIYPILNYLLDHAYPKMPVFGVTPCPITIFTFGMFLWIREKVPLPIVAVPFLWSLVGASAAVSLGIVEDYGLVVAGAVSLIFIVTTNRRKVVHSS